MGLPRLNLLDIYVYNTRYWYHKNRKNISDCYFAGRDFWLFAARACFFRCWSNVISLSMCSQVCTPIVPYYNYIALDSNNVLRLTFLWMRPTVIATHPVGYPVIWACGFKAYPPDKNQASQCTISCQTICEIVSTTWTTYDIYGLVIGTSADHCRTVLYAN